MYDYGVINTSPNKIMEIIVFDKSGKFVDRIKFKEKGRHVEWDKTIQQDSDNYYIINTKLNKLTGKLIKINKKNLSVENI